MAQEYDNTNRGVLFDNDRKETDKHPDFKGTVNVDGKDYWLSGWLAPEDSKAYMKLSVQPKEARQERGERPARQSKPAAAADDFDADSSIPF